MGLLRLFYNWDCRQVTEKHCLEIGEQDWLMTLRDPEAIGNDTKVSFS